MMAAVRRPRSHRKVAAFNFLSNISLDGTHNDTKYGLLKKKGAPHGQRKCNKDNCQEDEPPDDRTDENSDPSPCALQSKTMPVKDGAAQEAAKNRVPCASKAFDNLITAASTVLTPAGVAVPDNPPSSCTDQHGADDPAQSQNPPSENNQNEAPSSTTNNNHHGSKRSR
jgi:hypothetical protein